jgi:hypothetical protein
MYFQLVAIAVSLTMICSYDDQHYNYYGKKEGGPAAALRRRERAKEYYQRQIMFGDGYGGHPYNNNANSRRYQQHQ